jgi:hypothetical protein
VVDACVAVVVAVMISCGPIPPHSFASSVVTDRAQPPQSTRAYSVTVSVYTVLAISGVKFSPWNPEMTDVKTVVHVGVPSGPSPASVPVPDFRGGGVGRGTGFAQTPAAKARRYNDCSIVDAISSDYSYQLDTRVGETITGSRQDMEMDI